MSRWILTSLFFACCLALACANQASDGHSTEGDDDDEAACPAKSHGEGITIASFRWTELGVYFTIAAFVVIAGFAKLGFHKLSWLSSKVPESCLLVLLGLVVSALIYSISSDSDAPELEDPCIAKFKFPQFTSEVFFLILLPPIVLESAYSLHDRVFLDNLGTVLVFAVIGTLLNVFSIGGSLYGVGAAGFIPEMNVTLTDAFVFSSLISAVDPVAVLAIFQELGVNQNLYFLIFGESLLNDGVTVVLYNTMQSFRRMVAVRVEDFFLAIVAFFVVSLGGIFIGVIYGILSAIITKWTSNVRVVEPLAILGLAYLSYLTAELFHFSGIICLIVCGIMQAHYGFFNISHKSYICVKYFIKMASATSDTIIFMFLGIVLVNDDHKFNYAFVLWSLFFCFIFRFIIVFALSAVMNAYRSKSIAFEEQFMTAYGGLRGAVAFSLASTLDKEMDERNTYIFTTLIVVLFTVFVQGITIKPLVHLLKIKKRNKDKRNLVEEIAETSMDHMMAGVEEILGHRGDFYLREVIMHYNEKYFKKWFLRNGCETKLTRLFEKIALSEHYAHLYGPVALVEDRAMKPLINYGTSQEALVDMEEQSDQTPEQALFRASLARRLSMDMVRSASRRVSVISTEKAAPPRKRSIFSGRSFRSRPGTVATSPPCDNDVLRRALRNNRYNKLHCTYNRNLVHEEDQELQNHLNRRSLNAHRMSVIAFPGYQENASDDEDFTSSTAEERRPPRPTDRHTLPGQVSPPMPSRDAISFESMARSLMERHRRAALFRRELQRAATPLAEADSESQQSISAAVATAVSRSAGNHKNETDEEIPLVEVISQGSKEEKS